jgi:3-phosphoshikimate 1-carboxyvinyltransferase
MEHNNLLVRKCSNLAGTIKAPPSKSYTHRAIIIGSINGEARIINPLYSEDTAATINVLEAMGAVVRKEEGYLDIRGFNRVPRLQKGFINVGESGTLLRFILSLLPLCKGEIIVTGEKTLRNRPNTTIINALRSWGIKISGQGRDHKLPITIIGKGGIKGGETEISGKMSSQSISSLLITAPLAKNDTTVIVTDRIVSRPYIDVTLDVLRWAGIKVKRRGYKSFHIKSNQEFNPREEFIVHGDYSSAAFLIAAACLVKSNVTIDDLVEDKQGDRKIIDILTRMGARIEMAKDSIKIRGPFELKGIDIDCCDTPDLVPILAVIGSFAKGRTRIYNISHLTYKESNRIDAPAGELTKLGASVYISNNELIVHHSTLKPGTVSSCRDHRIAMALAIAGLRIGNLKIEGYGCIAKSYPDFISDMRSIGARFKIM